MSFDNLTLLTDYYQLTMMQGYFNLGLRNTTAVFDMYYRENPSKGGYSIIAGLEQLIDYIKNISFSEEDIKFLREKKIFNDEFLDMLKNFKFTGDIFAIKEGTVVFPNEPLIRVHAPIIEAQFIETALLNIINYQSLIATKASRVFNITRGEKVLEFGLRRAQGTYAGLYGARAAIIGGCFATSNVLAGKNFNINIAGTHSHSWVMTFKDEITAFREYIKFYPNNCFLLVDTYNTIYSGVPNAIKVFNEQREKNIHLGNYGIRLDSGDLAYLSKNARKMLDEAGHEKALICASNDLDENLIKELKLQGAKIDVWGVGTKLITSHDWPSFGGVYKLVHQTDEDGNQTYKIKISENSSKVTTPGIKNVYRLLDKNTNKIKGDLITLEHETIDISKDLTIFHPVDTWKKIKLKANTFYVEKLLMPIFLKGNCVYESPSVLDIQKYCISQLDLLWEEVTRFSNPHNIPVDLSKELWTLKNNMVEKSKVY